MEKHVKAFWNYIKEFRGTANLDNVFLKWAATKNLTLNDAQKVWQQVNRDIYATFGKKEAVSINATPEELKEMGLAGNPATPELGMGAGDLGELNKELDTAAQPGTENMPTGAPEEKDILSTLEDEDEGTTPPTGEETPTTEIPELAGTPPPM